MCVCQRATYAGTTHTAVMAQILVALLSIWLPAKELGEAVDNGSSTQSPAVNVGDLNGVPGTWLGPGPVQDFLITCEAIC